MGLIKRSYDNYSSVVGNNSMMRIEFEDDRNKDTPIYVMHYLKLEFVKDFIDSQRLIEESSDSKSVGQKTFLTVSILEELPIPIFYESNGEYRDYIHSRLSVLDTFESIRHKILFLEDNLKKLNFQEGSISLSKSITFSSQAERTYQLAEKLNEFEEMLEEIIEPETFYTYEKEQAKLPF